MRTLLIVEDDDEIRRVMRGMLHGMGLTIAEAANGSEAFHAVAANRPDVMIVDLMMPEMNGLALLDKLRSAGLMDPIAVIVTTGSITPSSVVRDKGALGVLRKPFTRAELRAAVQTVVRRRTSGRRSPASATRPCVLIVDDDADLRRLLETTLRLDGYETMAATNGADALECMRARKPATVLLDLMMPTMDGWLFRRRQLEDPAFASVPVVCMTGVADPAEVEAQLGVPCLPKPIDVDALLNELDLIYTSGR
jgi:two-component system chemotaxis response regulator CheY